MKKFFTLFLALTMLLSLAACGGSAPEATPEPTPASTPQPTVEPTPEPVEEPAEEEPDPILGVYDPDSYTYVNEFLGISFEMDESWEVFDEEAIAELNGLVSEMLTDTELAEVLEKSGSVQVFYAQIEDGLVNVNIGIEDLGLLYGKVLDENAYLNLSLEELTPEAFEAMGLANVSVETTSMTFAGQEHAAVTIHGDIEGYDLYQCLICMKVDRYMSAVTVTCLLDDLTGDILASFNSL